MYPERQSVVTVFVRHKESCKQKRHGEFFRGCDCAKWFRWTRGGKQERRTANTRDWNTADDIARDIQRQLNSGQLNSGDSPVPVPIATFAQPTIEDAIKTHLTAKRGENLSPATLRKLKYQLTLFEKFMSHRSKFFPSEITTTDVIDFRASWESWKSGVTRQKAQQNLRGFLRFCCKGNLLGLLEVLKAIKPSQEDKARLEPQPFSEAELQRLLAQVPKTFDAEKAVRVTALIHCQVSTGLAIRDTVQLERKNISDGWLRIDRQKTKKPVRQKLNGGLYQELLTVTNGNPRFVFWNGTSLPESATGLWQEDLRTLMRKAGVYIKGNLSHRFRDTFVSDALARGWAIGDVADALGDTVSIVERHYKSLVDKRQEDRLAKLSTRSWD